MRRISETWKQQRSRQTFSKSANLIHENLTTASNLSNQGEENSGSTDGEWLTASKERVSRSVADRTAKQYARSKCQRNVIDVEDTEFSNESSELNSQNEGPTPRGKSRSKKSGKAGLFHKKRKSFEPLGFSGDLDEQMLDLLNEDEGNPSKQTTKTHEKSKVSPLKHKGNVFVGLGRECISTPVSEASSGHTVQREVCQTTECNDHLKVKKKRPGVSESSNVIEKSTGRLSLDNWSLPPPVLQKYKDIGISEMFKWQAECLLTGKSLQGGNLVYSAPTSAGKTLVAEILMLKRVLETNKKAIYILPFVSVAKEKVYYLQSLYEEVGVKVEGFVGSQAPSGGFAATDVAVCTIEKANSLINRLIDEKNVSDLGCVVVDEMHMIGDPNRGYLLELLLSKITFLTSNLSPETPDTNSREQQIQVIGMSATLPNLPMLASWLKADLYVTNFRPVPLTEMIKVGRRLLDTTQAVVGEIKDEDVVSGDEHHVVPLCKETLSEGNSVLIFCPTKIWCEKLAETMSRLIGEENQRVVTVLRKSQQSVATPTQFYNAESCFEVIQQLRSTPVGLDPVLEKVVPKAVAFHHAGLTFDEREIIEGAFRNGTIKILIATSTLSSGVNLPARRVIIRTPIFHGKLLDALIYKQMSGRAGRKGKDVQGESVLVCKETEKQKAMSLLQSHLKPVYSCLLGEKGNKGLTSMKRALLEVIGGSVANTIQEIKRYAACTYLHTCIAHKTDCDPDTAVKSTVDFLIENEFIAARRNDKAELQQKTNEEDIYYPTQLGKATLASSLSPDEALVVFTELQTARRCFVLENELHIIYQVTPIYLQDQWPDLDWYNYLSIWERLSTQFKRVGELVGIKESFLARSVRSRAPMRTQEQRRTAAVHRRFYAALVLQDLVSEVSITAVSRKFGINKGLVQSLQGAAATFAGMVTVFCQKLGWLNLELIVQQFQSRLSFGISRELCDLVRISFLNGARARLLYNSGYHTINAIALSSAADIGALLISAAPFESKKAVDGENEREISARKRARSIWVTGKEGLTEMEAAYLIVKEAQKIVQKDLRAMGIMVNDVVARGAVDPPAVPNRSFVSDGAKEDPTSRQGKGSVAVVDGYLQEGASVPKSEAVASCSKTSSPSISHINIKNVNSTGMTRISEASPAKRRRGEVDKTPKIQSPKIQKIESFSSELVRGNSELISRSSVAKEKNPDSPQSVIPLKKSNIAKTAGQRERWSTGCGYSTATEWGVSVDLAERQQVSKMPCHAPSFPKDKQPDTTKSTETTHPPKESTEAQVNQSIISNSSCLEHCNISRSLSLSADLYSPPLIPEAHHSSARLITCSCSASDYDFDNSMSILPSQRDCVEQQSSMDLNDLTPELYPQSPEKDKPDLSGKGSVVLHEEGGDNVLRHIHRRESAVQEFHSSKKHSSHRDFKCEEENQLSLFLSDSESVDAPENEDLHFSSNLNFKAAVTELRQESLSPEFPPDQATKSHNASHEGFISWGCDSLEPVIDQLQSQLNSKFAGRSKHSPLSPELIKNLSSEILLTPVLCKSETPDGTDEEIGCSTKEVSRRHSAIYSSAPLPETGEFLVIDVTAHHDLFDTFIKEWDAQPTFSFAVACEGNTKDSWKIGSRLTACGGSTMKNYGIPAQEGAYNVVGLSVSWEAKDAYFISLEEYPPGECVDVSESNEHVAPNQLDPGLSLQSRLQAVRQVLNKTDTCKIAYDMKSHYKVLHRCCDVVLSDKIKDPKIAGWLLDPGDKAHSLNALTARFLGQDFGALLEGLGIIPGYGSPALATQASTSGRVRACVESVLSQSLMKVLEERLATDELTEAFLCIEMPILRPLAHMEMDGIGFSAIECEKLKSILKEKLSSLEEKCYILAKRTFSLSSPEDVARVLYIDLKLPYEGKTDQRSLNKLGPRALGRKLKHLSTAKAALEKIRKLHPLPDLILDWRRVNNALIKVVFPLFRERKFNDNMNMYRIYPESQTHTATGRISFTEPNLQNVPRDFEIELPSLIKDSPPPSSKDAKKSLRKPVSVGMKNNSVPGPLAGVSDNSDKSMYSISMRTSFVPFQDGVFLAADYSQMELRIIAHLSKDQKLIQILNNEGDVFRMIAGEIFNMPVEKVDTKKRQAAKHICYGIIYGIGAKALGEQLELSDHEAQKYMNKFMGNFLGVRAFIKSSVNEAKANGYVRTLMKRRRYLTAINSLNSHAKAHAERQAVNTTVQGSAADIAKLAMINVSNALRERFGLDSFKLNLEQRSKPVNLVLQLHDELLFEVEETSLPIVARIVKHEMETAFHLDVVMPVKLSVGTSWGTLQSYTSSG